MRWDKISQNDISLLNSESLPDVDDSLLIFFSLDISRRSELCECCEHGVVNIHIQSATVMVGSFSVSFILAKESKELK